MMLFSSVPAALAAGFLVSHLDAESNLWVVVRVDRTAHGLARGIAFAAPSPEEVPA